MDHLYHGYVSHNQIISSSAGPTNSFLWWASWSQEYRTRDGHQQLEPLLSLFQVDKWGWSPTWAWNLKMVVQGGANFLMVYEALMPKTMLNKAWRIPIICWGITYCMNGPMKKVHSIPIIHPYWPTIVGIPESPVRSVVFFFRPHEYYRCKMLPVGPHKPMAEVSKIGNL